MFLLVYLKGLALTLVCGVVETSGSSCGWWHIPYHYTYISDISFVIYVTHYVGTVCGVVEICMKLASYLLVVHINIVSYSSRISFDLYDSPCFENGSRRG